MAFTRSDLVDTAKQIGKKIGTDDVGGLAAEMAYGFIMALFPFLLFLVALSTFIEPVFGVDDLEQEIVDEIAKVAPEDVTGTVETLVSNVLSSRSATLMSIGFVLAIWSASGAVATMMKAVNRAYDIQETRPFWKKRGLAIILTLFSGLFFIASTVLIIGGDALGELVTDALNLGSAGEVGWNILRIIVVLALVSLAMAVIYWQAPAKDQHFAWVSPGSAFFVISWILATVAFSFYIANFGNYNETYGTIGGAIIMLFWLYITSFCIVTGAVINSVLERRYNPEGAMKDAVPERGAPEIPTAQDDATQDATQPREAEAVRARPQR